MERLARTVHARRRHVFGNVEARFVQHSAGSEGEHVAEAEDSVGPGGRGQFEQRAHSRESAWPVELALADRPDPAAAQRREMRGDLADGGDAVVQHTPLSPRPPTTCATAGRSRPPTSQRSWLGCRPAGLHRIVRPGQLDLNVPRRPARHLGRPMDDKVSAPVPEAGPDLSQARSTPGPIHAGPDP
ncbi:hypothetical protein [Streptomyces sp. SM13]|uniref:hypothetical protein n=1 Tax=Streptomyces sp. SM13 TaxID=1983803 RepID=UPI0035BC7F75